MIRQSLPVDELTLASGVDVPIYEVPIFVHQPKIKEIGVIGEKEFFSGCDLLLFSKNSLSEKDKIELQRFSDFDIIMSLMALSHHVKADGMINPDIQKKSEAAKNILSLFFPNYVCSIDTQQQRMMFYQYGDDNETVLNEFYFTNETYPIFQSVLKAILGKTRDGNGEDEYNPIGDKSSYIANKLKKAKQKIAQQNQNSSSHEPIPNSAFARYASILAVGQNRDVNSFYEKYTVYQLFEEFERYNLKVSYDVWLSAALAGAQGQETPENWMKDLHSNK